MSDPYSLVGRNALVCGASQGIGRACAEQIAARGARVTIVARNGETLQSVAAALPAGDGQTHDWISADFDDWTGVRDRVVPIVAERGPYHVLVNNSGGPPGGTAHEATPDAYAQAMTRHLLCGQVLVQAVLPGMRAAGYGRIINIISTSVVTPIRGLGVSNTTRGAVANWGRTLAHELGGDGITVNNILPGFTATQRLGELFSGKAERLGTTLEQVEAAAVATIPAGRLGEPDEIGTVAAFLASPAASYVNGVNLPVDGGRLAGQ